MGQVSVSTIRVSTTTECWRTLITWSVTHLTCVWIWIWLNGCPVKSPLTISWKLPITVIIKVTVTVTRCVLSWICHVTSSWRNYCRGSASQVKPLPEVTDSTILIGCWTKSAMGMAAITSVVTWLLISNRFRGWIFVCVPVWKRQTRMAGSLIITIPCGILTDSTKRSVKPPTTTTMKG